MNKQGNIDLPDEIIWKDRKRILGMPITFTRYEVVDDRLITRVGFFNTKTDEILLYRVLDLTLKRTLWQKMFGMGTITMHSADQTDGTFHIVNIARSDRVRRMLSKMIEELRDHRGVTGKEIIGAAADDYHHG
jgi:uncharacterized membrane protein YdbT with pleckstrin-like domain